MIPAVFFDIDGTLVSCQTQKEMSRLMFRDGILRFSHMLQIFFWHLGYKLGFYKETVKLRKKFYQFLKSPDKEKIDSLIAETYQSLIYPQIRYKFKSIISDFKKRGYAVIAVSGTLQQFCDLISAEFDIEEAFGTILQISNNHYTGEWAGEILEGFSKANFIKKIAEKKGINLAKSIAYADSHTDIPSLELFGRVIAVTPDRKLMKLAQEKNWEILGADVF